MKYAYIDEYGAFGFKFEDPGCTTSMILTAVLFDYVNLEQNTIVPIIARLVKCRNILFEGTDGSFDLFKKEEYKVLQKFIE